MGVPVWCSFWWPGTLSNALPSWIIWPDLLRCYSYTIGLIYLKYAIQWLLVYELQCLTITVVNLRTFPMVQVTLSTQFTIPPNLLPPQPKAPANLFCLYEFAYLNISYKWNHTIRGVWLCPSALATSTQHGVFKVCSCCSIYQSFTPFEGQKPFHYMGVVVVAWVDHTWFSHLGCFQFLALLNKLLWTFLYTF